MLPWQTVVFPPIVPGWAGKAPTVTASVWADEDPQALLAVTMMVPLLAPGVAVIALLVLLPVHPPGSVQV